MAMMHINMESEKVSVFQQYYFVYLYLFLELFKCALCVQTKVKLFSLFFSDLLSVCAWPALLELLFVISGHILPFLLGGAPCIQISDRLPDRGGQLTRPLELFTGNNGFLCQCVSLSLSRQYWRVLLALCT